MTFKERYPNVQQLLGATFEDLHVAAYAGRAVKRGSAYVASWLCRCACGNWHIVCTSDLNTGRAGSCGCRKKRLTRQRFKVAHPVKQHSLYRVWTGIKTRCYNPRYSGWKDYGGRGITMWPEWRTDFWAFATYVGPRPSNKHSIDRINNDGHYEPGNVRWATTQEQARNRRNNVTLTFQGKCATLAEWSKLCGLTTTVLWARYNRGWSAAAILTRPVTTKTEGRRMPLPDSWLSETCSE